MTLESALVAANSISDAVYRRVEGNYVELIQRALFDEKRSLRNDEVLAVMQAIALQLNAIAATKIATFEARLSAIEDRDAK
jgi:hypothetical protein